LGEYVFSKKILHCIDARNNKYADADCCGVLIERDCEDEGLRGREIMEIIYKLSYRYFYRRMAHITACIKTVI